MFKTRPFLTSEWGLRVIASETMQIRLQHLRLIEKTMPDPGGRDPYFYVVQEFLMDLDKHLLPSQEALAANFPDISIREQVLSEFNEWREGYAPMKKDKAVDEKSLIKKIQASIEERKGLIRKELVRKNSDWVNALLPRLIQNLQVGRLGDVQEQLFAEYSRMGGEGRKDQLFRKIMLFNCIYDYDTTGPDKMRKPNGAFWKDEDEIWDCWVGFAGSEDEAKRVCRTLDMVFRPLVEARASAA